MSMIRKNLRFALYLLVFFMVSACVEPVTPEFQFKEGLVYIDAFLSTNEGGSFVNVNESAEEFGVRVVRAIPGASVSFENMDTGESVPLAEAGETYLPPQDFKGASGDTWRLRVALANGTIYESLPEKILDPVAISELKVDYDPEVEFRELNGGRFVPGHAMSVSLQDPPADENYYYWSYRTFENLDYCQKCVDAVYRDGDCVAANLPGFGSRYFDYICETDCWRIRYPESVYILSDEFTNGKTISNFSIGNLLLYTKQPMVVEVQQFSLSPTAYTYYKVLKDIVDNTGGLNAPPPAALVGNLFNPQDQEDFVLGRFTAAASSVATIFIERGGTIDEPALETQEPIVLEPLVGSPYPPPATNFAPCLESKFRTAREPNGWINP